MGQPIFNEQPLGQQASILIFTNHPILHEPITPHTCVHPAVAIYRLFAPFARALFVAEDWDREWRLAEPWG